MLTANTFPTDKTCYNLRVTFIFLLNIATTLFMTGVIWFVQVVHYPLFSGIGTEAFAVYAARHSTLTTYVVIVPMFIELITASLLVWQRPPELTIWEVWLGLGLVGIIWLSTAYLQVPQHTALGAGFDNAAYTALVTTNWLRTAAWTLRSALVLWWLARLLRFT